MVTYKNDKGLKLVRAYYSGSDVLREGMALCYDWDNATAANRHYYVEKPSLNNAYHFAGIVVGGARHKAGPHEVDLLCPDGSFYHGVEVLTDENVAAGDMLGVVPSSYYFGRAVVSKPLLRVTVAADGTTNPALAAGELSTAFGWDSNPDVSSRFFTHFLGGDHIALEGATAAELATAGITIEGTSVGAAYGAAQLGTLVVTPNTSNIGQLNIGGGLASVAAGLPYLLATEASIFWRARVQYAAIDGDVGIGLFIDGANKADDGNRFSALDDYFGFFVDGDAGADVYVAYNKDNGTDRTADTGVDIAAATWIELAMLIRNRTSGTTASSGAKSLLAFVNGALTNTIDPSDLFNNDEGMHFSASTIGGASAVAATYDRIEINLHI